MNAAPIALVGQYVQDGKFYPCAKILNDDRDVVFNPTFVGAAMVLLYEAFLAHVPENLQCEFEQKFIEILPTIFSSKDELVERINKQ